jgi:hypothetical protein
MILSKRKKSINISSKFSPWVWITAKSHIMMIALVIYFSAISIAIAGPSPIKSPSTIPRNEWAKFCYSDLQIREYRLQPSMDTATPQSSFGPISRQWIKVLESIEDGGTKFCRSGPAGIQFPDMEQPPNAKQCRDNNNDNTKIVLNWQWKILPFAGLIPIIIFLIDSIYRYFYHNGKIEP